MINEVIGIDTTHEWCKDGFILLAFICVDKFFKTTITGMCLMIAEKAENYEFALNSYFDVFKKLPMTVYIDQHKGQESALKKCWPNVKRCYCLFHIYRNIQQNLANVLSNAANEFKREFTSCVKAKTELEFEKLWSQFYKKYVDQFSQKEVKNGVATTTGTPASEAISRYLDNLYDKRVHWADCWTHTSFTAGMHSTQRNESANLQIKMHIKHSWRTKFTRIFNIFNIVTTNQDLKVRFFPCSH